MMDPLKVSSQSHARKTAGAIAGLIRDHQHAEIQAIGAGAVHEAVKAIVFAKNYLREEGVHIAFTASLVNIKIMDKSVKGIQFIIEPRNVG